MAYKTVLVHLDQAPRCDVRIQLAAQISQSFGSHLIGAAMTGISRHVFNRGEYDLTDPVFSHHRDHLRQHARDVLKHFDQVAASLGKSCSCVGFTVSGTSRCGRCSRHADGRTKR